MDRNKESTEPSTKQELVRNTTFYYLIAVAIGFVVSDSYFDNFGIDFFNHANLIDYAKLPALYLGSILWFIITNLLALLIIPFIFKWLSINERDAFIANFLGIVFINIATFWIINQGRVDDVMFGNNGVFNVSHSSKKVIKCIAIIGATDSEYFFRDIVNNRTVIIPKSKIDQIVSILPERESRNIFGGRAPPPMLIRTEEGKDYFEFEAQHQQWVFDLYKYCGVEHPDYKDLKILKSKLIGWHHIRDEFHKAK